MSDLFVPLNRKRIIRVGVLFGLAILFASLIGIGLYFMKVISYKLIFVLVIAIPILLWYIFFSIKAFRTNDAGLLLTKTGIQDSLQHAKKGLIHWRYIEKISVQEVYSSTLLHLEVKDELDISKHKNIVINLSNFDYNTALLLQHIKAYAQKEFSIR